VSTGDFIALLTLLATVAPFGVFLGHKAAKRWHAVDAVLAAATRYLIATGDAHEVMAGRSSACNEMATARKAILTLKDRSLMDAVEALSQAMNLDDDDDRVRDALTAVRRLRRRHHG
jgi:hypothetical protein